MPFALEAEPLFGSFSFSHSYLDDYRNIKNVLI